MRVLVCGSRSWKDFETIQRVVGSLPAGTVVVHGDCSKGADRLAAWVARHCGLQVRAVPANWKKYGRAAGPKRNQRMVDLLDPTEDKVIAFMCTPDTPGTTDTIRRARARGIPVEVHREL